MLKRVDDILPADLKLDFAVIDIQGMEAEALLGMVGLIGRSPSLVMAINWGYFLLSSGSAT